MLFLQVNYTFDASIMNGFFDFARNEGFPTQFPANKTPVTVDVLEAGFILAFVMLVFCFYVIIPGFRGKYVSCEKKSHACMRAHTHTHTHTHIHTYIHIYRVCQEECARLRESVPYVKLYLYNSKHLCPK